MMSNLERTRWQIKTKQKSENCYNWARLKAESKWKVQVTFFSFNWATIYMYSWPVKSRCFWKTKLLETNQFTNETPAKALCSAVGKNETEIIEKVVWRLLHQHRKRRDSTAKTSRSSVCKTIPLSTFFPWSLWVPSWTPLPLFERSTGSPAQIPQITVKRDVKRYTQHLWL